MLHNRRRKAADNAAPAPAPTPKPKARKKAAAKKK